MEKIQINPTKIRKNTRLATLSIHIYIFIFLDLTYDYVSLRIFPLIWQPSEITLPHESSPHLKKRFMIPGQQSVIDP